MHVRPMRREDIPAAADVAMEAFKDDSVYNWICPRSHDPQLMVSNRRMYIRRFGQRFCNPSYVGLVCVEPSVTDPSIETVIGYAWWDREGPSSSAAQRAGTANRPGLANWFEHNIHGPLFEWWEYWIAPNPTVNYDRMYRWRNETSEQNWEKPLPEFWECSVLAVHPAHQGKGAGSMLLNWGIEQATREGVPVTLDASVKGRPIYAKRGFRGVDWLKLSVTEGRVDGYCMVYEPTPGKWLRDLKPGEQAWVEYNGKRREIDATWSDEALAVKRSKEDGTFPL